MPRLVARLKFDGPVAVREFPVLGGIRRNSMCVGGDLPSEEPSLPRGIELPR